MKSMLELDPFCPLVAHLFLWEGGTKERVVTQVVAHPYVPSMGELKSDFSLILFIVHL